ncbi:MAG: glycosyltransferase family 2 protein [bacterium]
MVRSIHSLLRQSWLQWELCVPGAWTVAAAIDKRIRAVDTRSSDTEIGELNALMAAATANFVGFLRAGDELSAGALHRVTRHAVRHPHVDLAYSDEVTLDEGGAIAAHFYKPDWSPHLLLSTNYLGGLLVVRRDMAHSAGGFRETAAGGHAYDFNLRVTEQARNIEHIDEALYLRRSPPPHSSQEGDLLVLHDALARRCISGHVTPARIDSDEARYIVRYPINEQPMVSIIIPTRNQDTILRRCIESIEARTTYPNFELLVIDHESDEPAARDYLASLRHRVLPYRGRFNYSRMNNMAVAAAKGDILVFLNNDTQVISPDWLEALLEQVLQPGVGIAGAKLLYPNHTVQHAGIIVGYQGNAANYGGMPHDDPGYNGFAGVVRECSAVTGACMMVRRNVFKELGGFNERMDRAWQDVDLCLRAGRHGHSVIFTPRALLYHDEGHTRGRFDDSPGEHASKRLLRRSHRYVLRHGDPFYNRNLSTCSDFFSFDPTKQTGLAVDSPPLIARFLHGSYPPHAPGQRWISRRCTLLLLTRSTCSHTLGFTVQANRAHCYRQWPLRVRLRVNGAAAADVTIQATDGHHDIRFLLPAGLAAHMIDICCSESFVPARLGINADHRDLSLMVSNVNADGDLLQATPFFRLRKIRGFHHRDPIKWAGPLAELELDTALPGPHTLAIRIRCSQSELYGVFPFRVFASIDNGEVATATFTSSDESTVLKVPTGAQGRLTRIGLMAESSFVPAHHDMGTDPRELSYVIEQLEFQPTLSPQPSVPRA